MDCYLDLILMHIKKIVHYCFWAIYMFVKRTAFDMNRDGSTDYHKIWNWKCPSNSVPLLHREVK